MPFVIAMLLLVAAVVVAVYAATPTSGRIRRELLAGSIVVGALAIVSVAITLPALIDGKQVEVVVIDSGTAP